MRRPVVSALLLLTAVVGATAQLNNYKNYHYLPGALKRFVDQAIREGNELLNYGHLNFDEIGQIAEVGSENVRIDVRLKLTTCSKASGFATHRPECPFKRLQVRCMVCGRCPYSRTPFADCIRRKDEHKRRALWNKECIPSSSGPGSLITYGGCPPPTYDGPVVRRITEELEPTTISPSSVTTGVPEGQQQHQGRQTVFHGSTFTIRCPSPVPTLMAPNTSTTPLPDNTTTTPGGSFYLTFDSSGANNNNNVTSFFHQNGSREDSADFLFPAADHTHEGTYRCAYGVVVDGGRVRSERWRGAPLSLSVVVTELRPAISVSPSVPGVPVQGPPRQGRRRQAMLQEGSVFSVTCSTEARHPNSSFHLAVNGDAKHGHALQPSINGSAHFPFPAADRHAHRGVYACVYGVAVEDGHVYASRSEPLSLGVAATELKPLIAVFSEGRWQAGPRVTLDEGSAFTVRCSIREEEEEGSFYLTSFGSGPDSHPQPCANGSAHFLFPAADRRGGDYGCVHNVTVGGYFYVRRSAPLSLAAREVTAAAAAKGPGLPTISVFPSSTVPGGGGPRRQVLEGFGFTVTCSVQEEQQHPGGVFYLTFGSKRIGAGKPSVHRSASFPLPAADRTHQGVYGCAYEVTSVDGSPASSQSEPLTLAVAAASDDSFRDDYDDSYDGDTVFASLTYPLNSTEYDYDEEDGSGGIEQVVQ